MITSDPTGECRFASSIFFIWRTEATEDENESSSTISEHAVWANFIAAWKSDRDLNFRPNGKLPEAADILLAGIGADSSNEVKQPRPPEAVFIISTEVCPKEEPDDEFDETLWPFVNLKDK